MTRPRKTRFYMDSIPYVFTRYPNDRFLVHFFEGGQVRHFISGEIVDGALVGEYSDFSGPFRKSLSDKILAAGRATGRPETGRR